NSAPCLCKSTVSSSSLLMEPNFSSSSLKSTDFQNPNTPVFLNTLIFIFRFIFSTTFYDSYHHFKVFSQIHKAIILLFLMCLIKDAKSSSSTQHTVNLFYSNSF